MKKDVDLAEGILRQQLAGFNTMLQLIAQQSIKEKFAEWEKVNANGLLRPDLDVDAAPTPPPAPTPPTHAPTLAPTAPPKCNTNDMTIWKETGKAQFVESGSAAGKLRVSNDPYTRQAYVFMLIRCAFPSPIYLHACQFRAFVLRKAEKCSTSENVANCVSGEEQTTFGYSPSCAGCFGTLVCLCYCRTVIRISSNLVRASIGRLHEEQLFARLHSWREIQGGGAPEMFECDLRLLCVLTPLRVCVRMLILRFRALLVLCPITEMQEMRQEDVPARILVVHRHPEGRHPHIGIRARAVI